MPLWWRRGGGSRQRSPNFGGFLPVLNSILCRILFVFCALLTKRKFERKIPKNRNLAQKAGFYYSTLYADIKLSGS